MSAVIIRSTPPLGFYFGTKPVFIPDLSYHRLLSVPPQRRQLATDELDSGSVELDNGDHFLSDLFSSPPLSSKIEIYDDAGQLSVQGYLTGVNIQQSKLILQLEV